MLLVPLLALLAAQARAATPAPEPSDVLTRWTALGGEAVLQVRFAGSPHWIRGLGLTPRDEVTVEQEDLDHDGQMDVTVRVKSPTDQFLHHILLTAPLPPVLDLAAGKLFEDVVSDYDNFGFGSANVPCEAFDNSEPEDVGVFDRVIPGSRANMWTHDLSAFVPELTDWALLTVEFREAFSAHSGGAQVVFDTHAPLTVERTGLDCTGSCICAFGTVHTYTAFVPSSSFLLDGTLDVTLLAGGDELALDWSRMWILTL
jgi:hypothetical protein